MGIERRYKDPDEVVNFGIDWADRLGTATLLTSSWSVATGVTQVSSGFTDTQSSIKLSGGTLGNVYRITNQVTTSDGETLEYSIDIEIIDK